MSLDLSNICFALKHLYATFWSHFIVRFCLISWSCQEHKTPSSWGLDNKTFECGNTTLSLIEDANHSEWWNMSPSTLGTHWTDWHSWQFLLKTRFKISGNNYGTPRIKLGCFPLQVLQLQFPCCKSLFPRSLDTGLREGVPHSCIIQQYQTFLSLRWIYVERSCPHTDITLYKHEWGMFPDKSLPKV